MKLWVLVSAIAFAASATAVPLIRRWALRGSLVDVPNERSSHDVPKPRLGGVGIVVGAMAALLVWFALGKAGLDGKGQMALGLTLALGGVGLIDDLRPLSAGTRMLLYLVGAVLIAFFSYTLVGFSLPLVGTFGLGHAGGLVFTSLFVAWYTNLFNFMDGVDGIAGGAAIVTASALAITFGEHNDPLGIVAVAAASASAGFLLFNFAPSSIFMGDAGAVFLGSLLATLSVAVVQKGYLSLPASVLLMFPFVFDASFTLCRRALRKEKVWKAHRTHVYQQLCDLGWDHRNATNLYTVIAVGTAVTGLFLDTLPEGVAALVLLAWLVFSLAGSISVVRANSRRAS